MNIHEQTVEDNTRKMQHHVCRGTAERGLWTTYLKVRHFKTVLKLTGKI